MPTLNSQEHSWWCVAWLGHSLGYPKNQALQAGQSGQEGFQERLLLRNPPQRQEMSSKLQCMLLEIFSFKYKLSLTAFQSSGFIFLQV